MGERGEVANVLGEPCRCWLPMRHTAAEHGALEADVTAADLGAYGLSA
jgi:hypothetical protein